MYGGGSASKLTAGALAGVLAVGMIPAAAFAEDEAVEPVDEAAIELQVATPATSLANGTVAVATDGEDGPEVTVADGNKVTITEDGEAHVVVPVEIKAAGDTATTDIAAANNNTADSYVVTYYTAKPTAIGNANASTGVVAITGGTVVPAGADATAAPAGSAAAMAEADAAKDAGSQYWVVITPNTKSTPYTKADGDNGIILEVTIEAAKSQEVVAYEGTNANDTTFNYIGKALTVNFKKADGTKLVKGTDYDEVKYGDEGKGVTSSAGTGYDTLTAPGTKIAYLYSGGTLVGKATVKVDPFDLSSAVASYDDQSSTITAPTGANIKLDNKAVNSTTADGGLTYDIDDKIEVEWVSAKDADGNAITVKSLEAPGTYTYKVKPLASANTSPVYVTGEKEFTFDVVKASDTVDADDFKYGSTQTFAAITTAGGLKVNPDKGEAWNEKSINITVNGKEYTPGNGIEVTYVNTETKKDATAADLANPGKYAVTAKLLGSATSYAAAGSATIDVIVSKGEIADSDITFYQKGKVIGNTIATYTGKDLLADITTQVKDKSGKVLTEGTDYKVVVKKGDAEVTEAIDQGTYTLEVKSDTYTIDGTATSITLTVNPFTVKSVRAANTYKVIDKTDGKTVTDQYFTYTGKEIVPEIEYLVKAATATTEAVWAALPADAYTIAIADDAGNKATLKDEGKYAITFKDASAKDNYTIAIEAGAADTDYKNVVADNKTLHVKVSADRTFIDVPTDAWYAPYVDQANNQGYMTGIGGTKNFDPKGTLTRAQAAEVIYKMSGGKANSDGEDDGAINTNKGYDTGFSDVNPNAWYAASVYWASNAGIVNGYAGTDKFGPNDPVTREQFACMLQRYAKSKGESVTGDPAALAEYADGSKVSSWAKDAMAWAVGKEIMGANNTLNPTSKIIRAEAAKMTVVAQPKKLA